MPANNFVRVRIDSAIKHDAAAVLATMGLTVSDLCRYECVLPLVLRVFVVV